LVDSFLYLYLTCYVDKLVSPSCFLPTYILMLTNWCRHLVFCLPIYLCWQIGVAILFSAYIYTNVDKLVSPSCFLPTYILMLTNWCRHLVFCLPIYWCWQIGVAILFSAYTMTCYVDKLVSPSCFLPTY
jgi:hypothetical protein